MIHQLSQAPTTPHNPTMKTLAELQAEMEREREILLRDRTITAGFGLCAAISWADNSTDVDLVPMEIAG